VVNTLSSVHFGMNAAVRTPNEFELSLRVRCGALTLARHSNPKMGKEITDAIYECFQNGSVVCAYASLFLNNSYGPDGSRSAVRNSFL
jgi:hypothetical protein